MSVSVDFSIFPQKRYKKKKKDLKKQNQEDTQQRYLILAWMVEGVGVGS